MSYYAVSQMVASQSLRDRITSAVAQEGEPNPFTWVVEHVYQVVSHADWIEKWDYAQDTYNINMNPDTGARDDVISDEMILASVQAVRGTPAPA